MRLDIRILGVQLGDVLAEDGRFVVSDGDVYIGIVPLTPENLGQSEPFVVWRDADETVISILNYEGPAKVFWEYRSLAGPFWKRNLRNGFAIWIAARNEFASGEAFRESSANVPLVDELDGARRRIVFGDVELEYDLREMWP